MDEPARKPPEEPGSERNVLANRDLWRYLFAGTQLAVTVAIFAGIGWWLDGKFGWSPWGVLILGTLGVAAGLYHFVKDAFR